MREIHPSELIGQINDLRYAKLTTWALLILSIVLCASAATIKDKNIKIGLSGSALVIAGLCNSSKSQLKSKKELLGDVSEASKVGFRSVLASYFLPASKLSISLDINTWKPELFNWELFNAKPEKYPHLGVVAESGGGKSTFAEWLCTWLDGTHIAFAPHYKPGDFPGIPIFATARNWGKDGDDAVNFDELIDASPGRHKNISYSAGFKALYIEMNRRYELRDRGINDFPTINIHLDEFNAFIASVDFSDEPGTGLAFVLLRLLMEARKVGIRLIAYLQSDSVEDLKLKGRGQARKNFKFIRLGADGLNHVKKLSTKDYPLLVWLKKEMKLADTYPCTVEDCFTWIPNFKRGQPVLQPNQSAETIIEPVIMPEVVVEKVLIDQLTEQQRMIFEYAQSRPNQKIVADNIKQSLTHFKTGNYTPSDIRVLFQSLADLGYGTTLGEGDRLGFIYYNDLHQNSR